MTTFLKLTDSVVMSGVKRKILVRVDAIDEIYRHSSRDETVVRFSGDMTAQVLETMEEIEDAISALVIKVRDDD